MALLNSNLEVVMEKYKQHLECRCPTCTAIKIGGIWIRQQMLTLLAMFFPEGLPKEACGDCDQQKERYTH